MEQTHSHGKILIDFIVLLLVSVLFLFCGRFVPALGTFVMFIWAVPVLLAVLRCGMGSGVLLAVIVSLCGFGFLGPYDGVSIVGNMAILGLFYGVRLKKKASPGMTLLGGIIITLICEVAFLLVARQFAGVSLGDLQASFESYMTEVYGLYANAGLADAAMAENMSLGAYVKNLAAMMSALLPSFYFIASMTIGFLNYVIGQFYLKRHGYDIVSLPPFREWHLPWWLLWGVVIALGLLVGGNFLDNETWGIIAKNIIVCYVPVFVIAGIALLRHYFVKWNLSNGIQVFLWIMMVLFISFALVFLALIGAADTALNYRAASKKKKNNDGGHEI